MITEYQRELQHNYLIIREENVGTMHACETEDYKIPMLQNLTGEVLLPVTVHYKDGQPVFFYEISSKQSLDRIVKKSPMTYKNLTALVRDMQSVLKELELYFLPETGIILLPEYIYVNMDTGSYQFCYYIGQEMNVKESLHKLFEYLLNYLDYQDKTGVAVAYEWYRLSAGENYSIYDMKEIEQSEPKEEPEKSVSSKISQEGSIEEEAIIPEVNRQESSRGLLQKIFGKKESGHEDSEEVKQSDLSEETVEKPVFLEECAKKEAESCGVAQGETVYLFQKTERKTKRLLCKNMAEETDFLLEKLPFLIGKGEGFVDGILHSPSVSRMHAQIEFEEGTYYVRDLNSTNGTFVNGQLLEMNELVKLEQGDRISFADVEYEFL